MVISSLEKGQRLEIIRLGLILKRMSLHVLDPSNFDNLREEVVEVLCLLEREFASIILDSLLDDLNGTTILTKGTTCTILKVDVSKSLHY